MPALSYMEAHIIARDLGCLMSSRDLAPAASYRPAAPATHPRGGRIANVAEWWTRRRTVHALRRLPDGLLRDIGIERDSIDEVARAMASAARMRPPLRA